MSKLVIVESPAKAHTIQKYLGPDYEVLASMGHVRDLPASRLSVDVKNDFAPNYENIKGKGELIKKLRNEAKKSDYVYLATDPDREGEAISWHLAQLLKLDETEPNRVTFNEITKSGIQYGMEHPRCIDQQLVDAQQARRILDRIVGYELSPLLWKKIRRGLSAGRVQSVAMRLVAEQLAVVEGIHAPAVDGRINKAAANLHKLRDKASVRQGNVYRMACRQKRGKQIFSKAIQTDIIVGKNQNSLT